MLNDDQAVVSLFEDGHKLDGGETSSDHWPRKPPMQPAENARVIACNKENFVTLQIEVVAGSRFSE